MKLGAWFIAPGRRLDIVAGLVDGVLTALTLTAAKLLQPGGSVSLGLALRVSAAAGLTTLVVFFLAHYAQMRTQLIRAERELNVMRHGRLARSNLGGQVLAESLADAALAGGCSLFGAVLPMGLVLLLPGPAWFGCALAILLLGAMGAILAKTFFGSPLRWSLALVAAGIALTAIGWALHIAE